MYAGLMRTRFYLLCAAYGALFKGLTIATRYSLLRKQFKDENGEEIPIFKYQLQKQKLYSNLAKAYAMSASMRKVREIVLLNAQKNKNGDFSLLQPSHIMLSGYKALFTNWNTKGIIELINACGGHGFSHYSGLPNILTESFPDTILEGENTVLLLQVARNLLKAAQNVQSGEIEKLGRGMRYLGLEDVTDFNLSDLRSREQIVKAFMAISAFHVQETSLKMYNYVMAGINPTKVYLISF